ncbi:MAG: hydrogenase formation protein HypD [Desulfobacteraceae bacterium]|nr:MAG: hydrogenase formation protein HypD [Desulfobacteraceae bacterium]
MRHSEEYRDPDMAKRISQRIREISRRKTRIMEVCGTHTMSIFRFGIRSLLPETISLISGPGCPVCVTAQREIDACIEISRMENVTVATFGDLMRVPGTDSSLQKERANGRDVQVVYSTFDAMGLARKNPERRVVFLGVGFETTAPTIAASILSAREQGLENYCVFSAHKLVPPALEALSAAERVAIDGLMLPGHVSVIIGEKAYRPVVEKYRIPCAIAGFEPVDILHAIHSLCSRIEQGVAGLENCYPRAVSSEGNRKARETMDTVFEKRDAQWRGLGVIPQSGLSIREEFSSFDAERLFDLAIPFSREPAGCSCGQVLTGRKIPPECPLYAKVCTPTSPVGPCMVSSEGTCAAYFRYS